MQKDEKSAMLRKIEDHGRNVTQARLDKARTLAEERERLKNSISEPELLSDVQDVIDLANAARMSEINLDRFISEGIHRRLGFISNPGDAGFAYIGYIMGGAGGNVHFAMDSAGPHGFQFGMNMKNISFARPVTKHMAGFLKDWPEFRRQFMEYLEKAVT